MKRQLITQLMAWKARSGRKPLILKGVRQSGKTYLLEEFGQRHFPNYHLINFEKQTGVHALFDGDLVPARILDALRFYLQKPIDPKTDLLIFDEIQACPRALTSLKYFCEDMPELALCAAGSLLGLHLNQGSYPVGKVEMMQLFPMTFTEFLSGIGDERAANYISEMHGSSQISDFIHGHLWERLKYYFITGGLPEVVSIFAETQNNLYDATLAVREKQEQLIDAYYADIAKHSGKINAMHIDRTWRAIPMQLSQSKDSSINRFRFKGVMPGVNRYSQLVNVIDWLLAASLAVKLPVVDTARMPLMAFAKENMFKLFMFDVGILGAMSGLSPKAILDYDYGTYKGCFAENFVMQQLQATGHQHVASWQDGRSEVEFLLQHENKIIPIEVKSGGIMRAKSLQKYMEKYMPETSVIFSANNLHVDSAKSLFRLPLYLAECMGSFIV